MSMEQLYGRFIQGGALPSNVAEYLWNEGFTSVESLRLLPLGDLKELENLLPDCPNIQQTAVKLAIRRLVTELNKPPVAPRPVHLNKPTEVPPPRPAPVIDEVPSIIPKISKLSLSTEPIVIPLADQSCQIGQLFNANTSQFLNKFYWPDDEIDQNITVEELSSGPIISAHDLTTVSDRLDALGLKGNYDMRLNVLFGLASRNDAAQNLLNLNYKAINSDCYCIRFSSRTEQKIVKGMTINRASDSATHVVTGVVFGIDQYFVFTEKHGASSNLQSRIEMLVAALNANPPSTRSLDYPLSEEESETYCDCFGDDNARSMNMFDSYFELKRYRDGRKKVEIQAKEIIARPVTADLFPHVSEDIAGRMERFYDRFEDAKGSILSVLIEAGSTLVSMNVLPSVKSAVSELNQKLNGLLINILDKYRQRQLREQEILKELQKIEGSFKKDAVEKIAQVIGGYCSSIKEALSLINDADIAVNPEDLDQHSSALVLTINVHSLDVAVSQSILSLFGKEYEERSSPQEVPVDFHDNLRLITDAFINFHRTNGAKTFFASSLTNRPDMEPISVQYFRNESDPMEIVSIPTPVRAETIQAVGNSPTSIQLQWKSSNQSKISSVNDDQNNSLLIGYRITIVNVADGSSDFCNSTQKYEEYLVTGLTENTVYEFHIRPLCRDGLTMEDSRASRQFRTTEPERLAHRVLKTAELITDDPIPTYRLKRKTVLQDRTHEFVQYAIGKETSSQVGEKLLLLAGGTGSGKSTLVNAMVNFLYDVRADDDFRLKLISDQDEFAEAKTSHAGSSKTKLVSAYQLNGTKLPYRLTIVDTPGFGDTEGLDKDRDTVDYMKDWFESGALGKQKLIDAVCLVMRSSETRVTAQVKYELTSVIGLFTRDMEPNILNLFTFSDGSNIPALAALKAENITVNAHFKFNNCAYFLRLRDDDMYKIFWRRANENYEKFFNHLEQLQPKSLALSLHALRLREEIELQARSLTDRVREEIEHLHNMTQIFQIVDQHRMEIARNMHFKTVQKVRQPREVKLPDGVLATTCLQCSYTCHKQCNVKDNGVLYWCGIMGIVIPPTREQLKKGGRGLDGAFQYTFLPTAEQEEAQRRNASCTICAPHCHWSKHVNKNNMIVFEDVMREITDEKILRKYEIAVNEANKTEKLVANMTDQFIAMEQQLGNTVAQIRKLLNQLDEISLRPGQMTDAEYIKMMIETETAEMKDGYQHRLEVLHRHLNTIEMIGRAHRGENLIQQIEHDAFEFLKTRFPELYANISNARQLRDQQPAVAAKPRGLYPSLALVF